MFGGCPLIPDRRTRGLKLKGTELDTFSNYVVLCLEDELPDHVRTIGLQRLVGWRTAAT